MRLLLALLALSFTKFSYTQPKISKSTFQDSIGAKRIDSIINVQLTSFHLDTLRFDSSGLKPDTYSQTHFFLTEKGTDRIVHAKIGSTTSAKINNDVREMTFKLTYDFINDGPARAEIWLGSQKQCAAYFVNNQLIHLWVFDGSIYNTEQTIIASFADLRAEYFRIKLKLKH